MHIIEEWLKRRKRKNGKRGMGKEKWKGRKRGAREIFSAIGASASCSSLQIQRQSTSYGLFLLVSGRAPRMIWETRLPNHLFRSRAASPKSWHTITPQSLYEIVSQKTTKNIRGGIETGVAMLSNKDDEHLRHTTCPGPASDEQSDAGPGRRLRSQPCFSKAKQKRNRNHNISEMFQKI